MGGPTVTQADLDKSVNAIRNRPLDAAAIAKGVVKTAPLLLLQFLLTRQKMQMYLI
jgi:hypothetical protein